MGTNNFHFRNTAHCFAFVAQPEPYIDEETGEESELSDIDYTLEYENFQEYLDDLLASEFGHDYSPGDGNDWHELSSYPSRVIGTVLKGRKYGDCYVYVEVTAVIRSGYYDGVCCDWLASFQIDSGEAMQDDIPSSEDIYTDLAWFSEKMNNGVCRMLAPKVEAWMENTLNDITNRVEKVFREATNHELIQLGTMSNGEAVYQAVVKQ